MQISKREAAERLWIQGVKLHFCDGDDYAVHLLLMSAFRICRDIVMKKDPDTEFITEWVRPEYVKLFLGFFAEISNYIKHADRDEHDLDHVDTLSEQNDLLLILLWHYFQLAFGAKSTNAFVTISMYVLLKKMPNLFSTTSAMQPQTLDYLERTSLDDLNSAMKVAIRNPDEAARVGQWAKQGWTW